MVRNFDSADTMNNTDNIDNTNAIMDRNTMTSKAAGSMEHIRSALIHWRPLGVICSALLLSACASTESYSSRQESLTPPKSLVPQPPPGGFNSLFKSKPDPVSQTASAPSQAAPSNPKPYQPIPQAIPQAVAQPMAQPEPEPIVAQPLPQSTQSFDQPLLPSQPISEVLTPPVVVASSESEETPEPSSWISRYPALAKEYEGYKETMAKLEKEYRQYEQKVQELQQKASRYWGDDNVVESNSDTYVKYGTGYTSRGEVDFAKGNIIVETVDEHDHKERLQEAIVTTLLTPDNARDPNLFSDQGITYTGPSVLEGQVKDNEGIIVQWEWRANRYADWLVENKLQKINSGNKVIYRVEIPMEANHEQVRGQKYESIVRQAALRYEVPESLIYSIMETESHFNPYATSHIPAYGLMQVVPSTAGRDVFERIKKRSDQPDRNYLFNPTNNIDTGTAYLGILDDIYLKGVTHPLAREYCVISAYNGGAGNVLRTFSTDRKKAVQIINSLSPQQVYVKLNRSHPSAESRQYIEKVVKAKQKYDGIAVAQNP